MILQERLVKATVPGPALLRRRRCVKLSESARRYRNSDILENSVAFCLILPSCVGIWEQLPRPDDGEALRSATLLVSVIVGLLPQGSPRPTGQSLTG